jgi:hypothetical protein
MSLCRDLRRSPHQRELLAVLDEPHRVERAAHIDDLVGGRHPVRTRARTSFRQLRDLRSQSANRPSGVNTAGLSAARSGKRVLSSPIGCVSSKPNTSRALGSVAKAVPDLALLVLLAAEQQVDDRHPGPRPGAITRPARESRQGNRI